MPPSTSRQVSTAANTVNIRLPTSSSAARVRKDALSVNRSTTTLPRTSWQYGRNANTAIAQPISTSSKSPGIGLSNSTRPITDATVSTMMPSSASPPAAATTTETR